jgi:NAD(P)-dependent dehydrogenase (short-subunit alcohol dehydrogenase family)
MDVNGKTVVVTGGASGIGAALSRRLAGAGAQLVIADLALEAAQALVDQIGGLAMPCDVTREADIQRVVADTEAKLGPGDTRHRPQTKIGS